MTDGLRITPIGHVRTAKRLKFDAPHQPDEAAEEMNRVELLPGFERALDDLEGFDRIWLIWWFHRNAGWRSRVLPPRGPAKRRGVFATRSPHRPNPLGLTCVPLLAVEGLTLTVGPLDLVDGTPIFDIKPYLPRVDAFPEASSGWIGEVEREMAAQERYGIEVSPLAERQLAYLREAWGIDFTPRAFDLLSLDPTPPPHPPNPPPRRPPLSDGVRAVAALLHGRGTPGADRVGREGVRGRSARVASGGAGSGSPDRVRAPVVLGHAR